MASISGLSVRVSAATAQFRAGMSRAEDAAGDLALSLRRLGFASESAESNLDEVGRSALGASGGMTTFGVSTEGAGFAVRGLSASIIASLIPALVALSAAVVPLVAALGGFVAIAGSIAGIGIIGALAAITTQTENLQNQFNGVVSALESAFAPAIQAAVGVLQSLMTEFEAIIPALVPTQEAVSEIASAFENLGSVVIQSLPAFVELATTLATEFLPPFVEWVEGVLPRVPGMIQALVSAFRRLLPQFMEAGRLLVQLLPPLNEFGFTVLRVLGPALADLARGGTRVLEFINQLDSRVQNAVAAFSLLAPVVVGLASVLTGPVALAIAGVVAAVAGFAKAWETNFGNIRGVVNGLWNLAQRAFSGIKGAFNDFTSGMDFAAIMDAVESFEDALGNQLMKTVKALKPVVKDFNEMLAENSDEFKIIGGFVSDLVVWFLRFAKIAVNTIYPAFRSLLIPALKATITVIDAVIDGIATAIQAGRKLSEGDYTAAAEIATGINVEESLGALTAGSQALSGNTQPTPQIDVKIEGDTGVVKDAVVEYSNDQGRTYRRTQGRQT